MTSDKPLSAFLARPGQTLDDHLEGVATVSDALVQEADKTPFGDDWSTVMQTVAWTHDIGKLTGYFQSYVGTGDRSAAESVELTYHGFFGGLVSAVVLGRSGFSGKTTAAGFYAVAKHHSVLQNVPDDIGSYHQRKSAVDGRYENAERQLQNIDETAALAADTILQRATDGEYGWEEFTSDGLDTARQTIAQLQPIVSGSETSEFYGCVLRMWSTLVAADKFDASDLAASLQERGTLTNVSRPSVTTLTEKVRKLSEIKLPDGNRAAAYLDTPDKSLPSADATLDQRLAALRTAANGRATSNILRNHADGERVFELTLPTGFGKTYSGLRAALSLASERDGRVIYALPYTSIIDQVDADIQDVFDVSPLDPGYTKHHHLADTRTVADEDDAFRDSESSGRETLHAEAWRSGIVLTTFTQLFESLAGPGNVQSAKLPALQNSVILVDEPQAVSLDWWGLMARLTKHLVSEYDATVLFMTATQPRILERFSSAPTPIPLADLREDCTELIRDSPRVTFDLHDSLVSHLDRERTRPLSLRDAANEIDDSIEGASNTLVVVNTVGSAESVADALSTESRINLADELLETHRTTDDTVTPESYLERLSEKRPDAEAVVATLTTRLRPCDRSVLLEALGLIVDPETATPFDEVPTVTVSTQLIEAGVDVSFDCLYRDYAPLPAIVQAAGRCNRRFSGQPASVTVWRLDGPPGDDYVPSQLIYGKKSLLRPTRVALSKLRNDTSTAKLPEAPVITNGVDWYYEALHEQRRTEDRDDDLAAAFDAAKGEKLRNASLVSTDYPTQDVLVLVSEDNIDTYEEYRQCKKDGEWQKARKLFQHLKDVLVSVPVEDEPTTEEPVVIWAQESSDAYDPVFGRGVTGIGEQSDSEV